MIRNLNFLPTKGGEMKGPAVFPNGSCIVPYNVVNGLRVGVDRDSDDAGLACIDLNPLFVKITSNQPGAPYLEVNTNGVQVKSTGEYSPTADSDVVSKGYVDSKRPVQKTVQLTVAGWSDKSQTVTVQGVLADSTKQAVIISAADLNSADEWSYCGLWCTAQAANSLTFTCAAVPESAINLRILLMEASQ